MKIFGIIHKKSPNKWVKLTHYASLCSASCATYPKRYVSLRTMQMKNIIFVIIFWYTGFAHAEMTLPTEMRGKCYVAEFNHPESRDKNVLTVCVNNNEATARMIYSNTGGLPAVCYHKGSQSKINDDEFQINFKEGRCDNNRSFSSDNIVCKRSTSNTFKCISPKGEMTLKKLHI